MTKHEELLEELMEVALKSRPEDIDKATRVLELLNDAEKRGLSIDVMEGIKN